MLALADLRSQHHPEPLQVLGGGVGVGVVGSVQKFPFLPVCSLTPKEFPFVLKWSSPTLPLCGWMFARAGLFFCLDFGTSGLLSEIFKGITGKYSRLRRSTESYQRVFAGIFSSFVSTNLLTWRACRRAHLFSHGSKRKTEKGMKFIVWISTLLGYC